MDVYVPENMLEFAREVIKPVDGDALEGIDFEDADAGEDE